MPEQIIELGLMSHRKGDGESFVSRLGRQFARLFSLLSEIAVESESLKTGEFRSQLEKWQAQLAQVTELRTLESIIEDCLNRCSKFFRYAQGYLNERETEIREVVDVLRDAVVKLTGDSNAFNERLLETSTRFQQMSEIEDIRELKIRIAREVGDLTRIVEDKRQQDEALYSRMSKRFDVLQEKLRKTRQEVLMDPLTQVGNRRNVDLSLKRLIQDPAKSPVVLAILDVDDFKKINDVHGHQAGDRALIEVARRLAAQVRSGDFLGRYGGDEFVVLFPGTSLSQAEIRFLQLLATMAATPLQYEEGGATHSIRLALSCGLAQGAPGESAEALMRRADEALYKAKKRGKNCLVTSHTS